MNKLFILSFLLVLPMCAGIKPEARSVISDKGTLADIPADYRAAAILPYYIDHFGTTWVLLGKEYRTDVKPNDDYWLYFQGNRDSRDKGPEYTAIRELNEETANIFNLDPNRPPFLGPFHIGALGKNVIYLYQSPDFIDPVEIEKAAAKLHAAGRGSAIEKTSWRWIPANDLLEIIDDNPGETRFDGGVEFDGMKIYPYLLRKLTDKDPKGRRSTYNRLNNAIVYGLSHPS